MIEKLIVTLILLAILFILVSIVPAIFHAGLLGNYMWEK